MKRTLILIGSLGLFATFAPAALSAQGRGAVNRQLTGTVTSASLHSITVRSATSSLTCAARFSQRLGTVVGKRATMNCRMASGRLVVSSVRILPAKAARTQSPRSQAPSSSSSSSTASSTDATDDDPAEADDDPGDATDDDPADDAEDDPADDD